MSPDIVWDGEKGDLALSALTDPINPAGLQAERPLETAVLIALMTDIRVDPTELRDGDRNKGWPGDGFDLEPGEHPLGSKLWLLRRSALAPDVEQKAVEYAEEALRPLIDQKVFARFDVAAAADRVRNRLDLTVQGYGRDGTQTYHEKFAVLWDRLGAPD
nr:phage GP46 family protein [Jiella sp. LLJ827]